MHLTRIIFFFLIAFKIALYFNNNRSLNYIN
jgi:hypothetical protein